MTNGIIYNNIHIDKNWLNLPMFYAGTIFRSIWGYKHIADYFTKTILIILTKLCEEMQITLNTYFICNICSIKYIQKHH